MSINLNEFNERENVSSKFQMANSISLLYNRSQLTNMIIVDYNDCD